MVILSAQDSDAHINKIAPDLFKAYPNIKSMAKADVESLLQYIGKVRSSKKKATWIIDIAQTVKQDKNIPITIEGLTSLKGIGRKSANVIMREAKAVPQGIMVDLHVVRVAPRLGIATAGTGDNIEKQLMQALPQDMWSEIGMAMSFLGRETCRPKNPKHDECIVSSDCQYCLLHKV